ncbi:hypothetical protein, partial [Escherichia coli]|uniref:hypothetical protein n=1 Tax=Escherichia coli TaxID=562 RepID=UPI001412E2DC
ISGATETTYRLTETDIGAVITAEMTFANERILSAPTTPVATENGEPGGVEISYETEIKTFTADAFGLWDADGFNDPVSLQWRLGGVSLDGAT